MAAVLALVALVDAALSSIDIATVVLLVAAALVGRAALRRAVLPPA